ncbi:MAG TPA: histone deacetylase family protein [Patescibacteria group bacterium]|nr:histone deacetylase family protein [Patescibacteria group bacterium]
MKIIYTDIQKKHNPIYEIYDGVKESYAEKKERITSIVSALKENNYTDFISPHHFPLSNITSLHHIAYFNFLSNRTKKIKEGEELYPSYFIMDTYTPLTKYTFEAAMASANVALTGAELILNGEKICYSLCRPPGHHAEERSSGGYCYFNNAAIAANYLSSQGRVAILDIDYHHGNGTQHFFYERNDVLYVSLHADPNLKFPYNSGFVDEIGKGKGEGFNKNYPLPLNISNIEYANILKRALKDIRDYKPNFLIVSAGFDTYEKDPIAGFALTIPFYKEIGQIISSLTMPKLIIQEGGYNIDDLGRIVVSFLKGFIK